VSRGLGAVERKLSAALSGDPPALRLAGGWFTIESLIIHAYPDGPEQEYMEAHWENLLVSWRRAARSLTRKGLIDRAWRAVSPEDMVIGADLSGPRRFHVVRRRW
jgi:hypothetical protein